MDSRKEKKYDNRKGSMAASAPAQGMGWTEMGHKGNLLCFDYGARYTSMHICQNLSNYTPKIGNSRWMQIIPG